MRRRQKEKEFDKNRRINTNIMDEEQMQQILQQLRVEHQREMEVLRQQIARPAVHNFELTTDQILQRFQRVKTFYGDQQYPVQEFIAAVENIATLCGHNAPLLRYGLQIILKEKIQGTAKTVIQRLGEATWEQVRNELKNHYRPRLSYKKLLDESRTLNVSNLRELFNTIRFINCQLNELYEFDDNKPGNYSPENNDKNLVDIIRDMLQGSYRSNITNGMTLMEAFNKFDEYNLLDDIDVIHFNYRKQNSNNFKTNNMNTNIQNRYKNRNFNNNNTYKSNSNNNLNSEKFYHHYNTFERSPNNFNNNINKRFYNHTERPFNNNHRYYNNNNLERTSFDNNRTNSHFNERPNFNRFNSNFNPRPNPNREFPNNPIPNRHHSNNTPPEPMEVGTLNEDVNFH